MKTKMRKGSVLIAAGLVLILAAAGLTGYNLWDDMRADKAVAAVTQQLAVQQSAKQEEQTNIQQSAETAAEPLIHELNPNMEMPVETVDGWDYIGTVAFPERGVELAVISDWSYPALKKAPCRYTGSAYTDDLILSAHNYRSHFACLKNMSIGERVTFTDMAGNVFTYEVVEIEVLAATAVEEMEAGDWDLTMFTCTTGGKSRLTVRCEEVDGWQEL